MSKLPPKLCFSQAELDILLQYRGLIYMTWGIVEPSIARCRSIAYGHLYLQLSDKRAQPSDIANEFSMVLYRNEV